MIRQLSLHITENTDPYQNLALEEFLTFHTEKEECILYLWQNRRTVVIGKNQNCWKECHVHRLEEDGGRLARRLSGGGAVFHDMGNLNFTFCMRKAEYDMERQTEVILKAVRQLGIPAEKTGRNDLTADGRKFSGNACCRSGDFCYHHGTLLVDVNRADMEKYLNVSREKLKARGVDSVRSRTINLRELDPSVTVSSMQTSMRRAFADVYGLPVKPLDEKRLDTGEIKELERKFASPEWKYGKTLPFQYQMSRRFSWGDVELQFQVAQGLITAARAYSDGMEPSLIEALPGLWTGCPCQAEALCRRMEAFEGEADAVSSSLTEQMKKDIRQLLADHL